MSDPMRLSSLFCYWLLLNSSYTGRMYRSKSMVYQYMPLKKNVKRETRVFVSISIMMSIMSKHLILHYRYSLLILLLSSAFLEHTSSCI